MIYHYNIINVTREKNPLLTFKLIQYYYKVKLELANTNIPFCWTYIHIAVKIYYTTNNIYPNELIIRKCWFVHNPVVDFLLYITVLRKDEMSNNIVQIKNCVFAHNNGMGRSLYRSRSVIKIVGLITKVSINDSNFCNNKDLGVIRQVVQLSSFTVVQGLINMDIFIANTNFSLTYNKSVIVLHNADLYLTGPVIFHNNSCST